MTSVMLNTPLLEPKYFTFPTSVQTSKGYNQTHIPTPLNDVYPNVAVFFFSFLL